MEGLGKYWISTRASVGVRVCGKTLIRCIISSFMSEIYEFILLYLGDML